MVVFVDEKDGFIVVVLQETNGRSVFVMMGLSAAVHECVTETALFLECRASRSMDRACQFRARRHVGREHPTPVVFNHFNLQLPYYAPTTS